MLSPDEITHVYNELETMFVALEASPEKGLGYIVERLTFCRAMQDRVADLRLKVNRALSQVMEAHLIAQQVFEITPTPDTKKKVRELEVLKSRHTMLAKMIAAQAQVLGRTAQDIRLLADLTKEQIKRGEINPEMSPGLVTDVPISELARDGGLPSTGSEEAGDGGQAEIPAAGSSVPPTPSAPPQAVVPHPAVGMVSFESAPVPPDDRIRLADTDSVSIDDLFEELSGAPQTPSPSIF